MTTMDLQLAFAGVVSVYWEAEKKAQGIARAVIDWVVDAARWAAREHVRRTGRQTGAHRSGRSVWDILHARPEEEQIHEWKPAGQHRDGRGWRYPSMVWALIERTSEHRNWECYLKVAVQNLMEDIQFMLKNPPQAITTHGCKDCMCGTIDIWRAELTEVNA